MKVKTLIVNIFISLLVFTTFSSLYFGLNNILNLTNLKLGNERNLIKGLIQDHLPDLSKGYNVKFTNSLAKLLYEENIPHVLFINNITDTEEVILPIFSSQKEVEKDKCIPSEEINLLNVSTIKCVKQSIVINFGNEEYDPMFIIEWPNPVIIKSSEYYQLVFNTLFFAITGLILSFSFYYILRRWLIKPFQEISHNLTSSTSSFIDKSQISKMPLELSILVENLNTSFSDISKLNKKLVDHAALEAKILLSSQVAHDIRSPLAALDMVISETDNLPEDQRAIIRYATQRINDIAENLLAKNKDSSTEANNRLEVQMLSGIIAPLLAEKRKSFQHRAGVEINSNFSKENFGVFIKADSVEFKRVLSNLINNSVEAIDDNGKIDIKILNSNNTVTIRVSDNGPGIRKDILEKLMQKGASFGKSKGNGLGLFHAKQTIVSFGGDIHIHSNIGVGTEVTINLPKEKPPNWFLAELKLNKKDKVIILDDDQSIHQVWDKRLNSLDLKASNIKVIHFYDPNEFKKWFALADDLTHHRYLFDYEIVNSEITGLSIIEELGISKSSVLVTSHYEETNIQTRCKKINLPLLPKNLTHYLPISINKS